MKVIVDSTTENMDFDDEIDDEDYIRCLVSQKYKIPWSFIEVRYEDSYFVTTARKFITKDATKILSQYTLAKIRYPTITPGEYGTIRIREYDDYSEAKEYYLELYKSAFSTSTDAKRTMERVSETIKEKNDIYLKRRQYLKDYLKEFAKHNSVKAENLKVVRNIYEIDLKDDDEYIFDQMRPSRQIPLIIFSRNSKKIYKVFKDSTYDPSWASIADQNFSDGIYFKLANVDTSRLKLGHLRVESQYSEGYIVDGVAKIFFNSTFGLDQKYVESFFAKFTGKSQTRTVGIDGSFEVEIPYYEKHLWTHLISLHPILSKMFFCNEMFKSFADKSRNSFYYDVFNHLKDDTSGAIPFTITHKDADVYTIYIRKGRTLQELSVIGSIICRALSAFQDTRILYNIRQNYKDFGINFPEKTGKKKVFERKGKRVALLNKLYGGNVSRQCPAQRQPTTIESSEVEKYRKKYGKDTVLVTKDYNWVCMDPEQEETEFLYPGFKTDKKQEEARCIPCCFKVNQFEKKTSKVNVCRDLEEGKKADVGPKKLGIGYIIETLKDLESDRYGDIPVLLKKILSRISWPRFKKDQSKVYYKLLRKGSPPTNDTIIHCFARAFEKDYDNAQDKIEYVKNLRIEMAKERDMLAVCKQSAYDYDLSDLQDILRDEHSDVDPEIFLGFLEEYYQVNCYAIKVSKDIPQGTIFYPKSMGYYIPRPKKFPNTISIVVSENSVGLSRCSILQEVSFESRASYGPFIIEDMSASGSLLVEWLDKLFVECSRPVKV